MPTAKLAIKVSGYKDLAKAIGVGPLEETIRRLPEEATFVRKLFSIPDKDMSIFLFALENEISADGKITVAKAVSLPGIFNPGKKIGIGIHFMFESLSPFSRSSLRVHELAHAFTYSLAEKPIHPTVHEGIAVFAETRYLLLMETDAWLRDEIRPKITPGAELTRFKEKRFREFMRGHKFFDKVADKLGPAQAFRSVVDNPPREHEISRPSRYVRRLGGYEHVFLEDFEIL